MNLASFPEQVLIDAGAERNTLTCVLKSNDAWLRLPIGFGSDEFGLGLNKALWTVVDHLYTRGGIADPITIYESLSREYQKELDDLGGWGYISTLLDLPLDPKNVEQEAKKLVELSTRRKIEEAGKKISSLSRDSDNLDRVREKIETAIAEIDNGDEEVSNIAENGMDFLEKKMANPVETPGLSSGFAEVDRLTQGFQSGRMYVVAARKKTGKSMILLNWAKHLAVDLQIPVLWISTEHTIDDEFSRLLALTSNVYEKEINNGMFTRIDQHVERVADAHDRIRKSPFHFSSMPFFNLEKIRRLTRKMVRVHGVKVLFFDYIKTPEENKNLAEWQELGRLAYGLKALATLEGIPVITAVQMNRAGQQNFKETGEMDSDEFAGSDRIAQAMSVGFILRYPNSNEVKIEPDQFRVLRCTDNRHGSTNLRLLLDFDGETSSITENHRL